jgi:glyoxylate reductase
MKIRYHNRSRLPPQLEGDAEYVSFDELLATSDILSLNLALNASTRHIIGAPEFQKMKDGIILVNTARGALIDEKALVAALDSGKVSYVLERVVAFALKGVLNVFLNRLHLPV